MRHIFDHMMESGHFVSRSVRRRLQFCELLSMPPSKVCPQCETKAESVLLVSAVQGFCCFCSLPYTFRYVFVNACSFSDHRARAKAL